MHLPLELKHQFRAVLKVHGVIVIPSAAPDETVPFKYPDYLHRDTVAVFDLLGFLDVYRDAIAVSALPLCSPDSSVVGSGVCQILFKMRPFSQFSWYSPSDTLIPPGKGDIAGK